MRCLWCFATIETDELTQSKNSCRNSLTQHSSRSILQIYIPWLGLFRLIILCTLVRDMWCVRAKQDKKDARNWLFWQWPIYVSVLWHAVSFSPSVFMAVQTYFMRGRLWVGLSALLPFAASESRTSRTKYSLTVPCFALLTYSVSSTILTMPICFKWNHLPLLWTRYFCHLFFRSWPCICVCHYEYIHPPDTYSSVVAGITPLYPGPTLRAPTLKRADRIPAYVYVHIDLPVYLIILNTFNCYVMKCYAHPRFQHIFQSFHHLSWIYRPAGGVP